jgi:hypothetical protein
LQFNTTIMILQLWKNSLIFWGFSNLVIILLKGILNKYGIDYNVLLVCNFYLFIITILSLAMMRNGLRSKQNSNFMLAFYGNAFLKIFVTLIAVFVYVKTAKNVSKSAILVSFLFYMVYTVLEVKELKKITEDIKNAKT